MEEALAKAKPLFGGEDSGYNLHKIARDLAVAHETSAFTDTDTLATWIERALMDVAVRSARLEEERITAIARERGWIV